MKPPSYLIRNAAPIAFIGVIVTWCIGWIFKEPGEGIFSIVDTLFSGLAFVGLVWAILIQREELKEQRNELALTRKELELTRQVFDDQGVTNRKQRFENSFFQLIAVHNDKARSFSILEKEFGAKAFARLFGEIKGTYSNVVQGAIGPEVLNHYRLLKSQFINLDYITYSNNLFNIISLIDKSTLVEPHEKILYYQILSNLLSSGELWLAFVESHERGVFEHLDKVDFFDNLTDLPKKNVPTVTFFK